MNSALGLSPKGSSGLYTLYVGSTTLALANVQQTTLDLVVQTKDGVVADQFRRLKANDLS